ncbi:hypothetical protein D3OALGA1CA_1073 [Olavius algarvensis associated proteobacterium Delta 3]|nr:hypothetical protein D3OALGA1CA_1073 [Olavius algarvensis associated proteobacterium Delta 3]CAB5139700.1 hypothetical protein D3OALGB2SA_4161 [Olavius algarvensis associated proteobacterium Delta 3]
MSSRILFISRNYPPQVGGLEQFSYHLIRQFELRGEADKIVLTRGRRHLFWFLPHAVARAAALIWRYRLHQVHLCDGLLSPVGMVLKRLTGVRVSVTVHGLDVVYPNHLYQTVISRCLARVDRVVGVSRATCQACLDRNVPSRRCRVIPNGIDYDAFTEPMAPQPIRSELARRLNRNLDGKILLLTVGRLIERKGVAWFVSEVLPRLGDGFLYLVAGRGPEEGAVRRAAMESGVGGRVLLLGRISDRFRNRLLWGSDIFVMPNLTVAGDMEGFGIAALEAGCCGLPVVASDIEGLKDAVIQGVTGYRVPSRSAVGFVERITGMDLDPSIVRETIRERFSWGRVYRQYRQQVFE